MPIKNSQLIPLYEELKDLMAPYAQKLSVRERPDDARWELWSDKPIEVDGRKRKDMFFAGLIIQKSYVGFYFMPVATDEEAREFFEPEMLAILKGKSCFYIKSLTPPIRAQIESALAKGYDLYHDRGWI